MNDTQIWLFVVYAFLVLGLAAIILGISHFLGERRGPSGRPQEPYESGILPTHSAAIRIPVQFYLMAMFFVIFDMEAVFIFAWAIVVREAGWLGFIEMTIFIGIVMVALFYLWKIGALEWGPRFEKIWKRMENSQQSTQGKFS